MHVLVLHHMVTKNLMFAVSLVHLQFRAQLQCTCLLLQPFIYFLLHLLLTGSYLTKGSNLLSLNDSIVKSFNAKLFIFTGKMYLDPHWRFLSTVIDIHSVQLHYSMWTPLHIIVIGIINVTTYKGNFRKLCTSNFVATVRKQAWVRLGKSGIQQPLILIFIESISMRNLKAWGS